jgi:hypothetical protein
MFLCQLDEIFLMLRSLVIQHSNHIAVFCFNGNDMIGFLRTTRHQHHGNACHN